MAIQQEIRGAAAWRTVLLGNLSIDLIHIGESEATDDYWPGAPLTLRMSHQYPRHCDFICQLYEWLCSCVMLIIVGLSFWETWVGVFCELVYSVSWCIMWVGVFCELVYSVSWCILWVGVFCELVYSVSWCILWVGVFCELVYYVLQTRLRAWDTTRTSSALSPACINTNYYNNNGLFEPEFCSLAAELLLKRQKKKVNILFSQSFGLHSLWWDRGIYALADSFNRWII